MSGDPAAEVPIKVSTQHNTSVLASSPEAEYRNCTHFAKRD